MKHLATLNKYFWKYRYRFLLGIVFIIVSNYFRILSPQVTGYVIDAVERQLPGYQPRSMRSGYDPLVRSLIDYLGSAQYSFSGKIAFCGITLLVLALLGGFFMFLMRQTIIVMSRHIEYDQKNEVYKHYQELDMSFYKTHSTGDLMNRITEDVSRVRSYTGPALMYFINLAATIGFCVFYMWNKNPRLTVYVLSPLPVLAFTIYYVNTIINRKSERLQSLLGDLTTGAQESYSGIRVIKSFVQESAMYRFFNNNSEEYKHNAIGLARVEAIYFPAMGLLIGLSTLLTVMIGGSYAINGEHAVTTGTIAEFVMYVIMLTFPVSAIGWTASMIQRAATSQRRLNEFLQRKPAIQNPPDAHNKKLEGQISFNHVDFTYPDTGIHAVKDFNLEIEKGQKVAIIGRTGSGKTTIAQLLLRMYDPIKGSISIDGINVERMDLKHLREQISYVPQDVFLFSDSIEKNIEFGLKDKVKGQVQEAAIQASVDREIRGLPKQYETVIGERGVTLSGGQKQRISIARALVKDPQIVIFDDCLSAVDTKTEKEILGNLYNFLKGKTSIIITHRIFSMFDFDKIIVLEDGKIVEEGTHEELLSKNGYYTYLYEQQQKQKGVDESQN
jgi:ATP-binding cassette, subfamily B, multidrug efflux pump